MYIVHTHCFLVDTISEFLYLGCQLYSAKVQNPAPEFKGKAVVGGEFKEIKLEDYKGKYVVLFFYPLDL